MTTDPILAVAPPTDTIPAPLTLQQRAEMVDEAKRLLKAVNADTTWHGKTKTFEDGQMVSRTQAACDAVWLLAYSTELAHKMDIAATLAQVEARA